MAELAKGFLDGFADITALVPECLDEAAPFMEIIELYRRPVAFITMYIYLLFTSADWFMTLPDPTVAQSGLISVLVGAGAAWFGLYVNSTSTQHDVVAKD